MPYRYLFHVTLGLIISGLILWGVFKLLQTLLDTFLQVNPTLGAGIIAASATIIVSVISVLIAKQMEFRATLSKEHREKKIPFYEGMVKFIFRTVFAEKLGLEPLTEKEMFQEMSKFTENLIVWGSDDVIDAWFKFRNKSIHGDGTGVNIMFAVEDLLLAIRRDLGHKNKGLKQGKVLGLFINDIHEHIKL